MASWPTDHFYFLTSGTLALSPERQSAGSQKLKMVG